MGMLLFSLFRNHSQTETILFGVFAAVIFVFLVIDLGFFNRSAKRISTKSALYQSIFWVFISALFGYLIYYFDEGGEGIAFHDVPPAQDTGILASWLYGSRGMACIHC